MKRILILTSGHLCSSPRTQKEAEALTSGGYDVVVRGYWFDSELIRRDRLLLHTRKWNFEPIVDFSPKHWLRNKSFRLRTYIERACFRGFNLFMPEILGYCAKEMLAVARKTRADLTIVRSKEGMWVGDKLLNEGFNVGVDFEDWFSENIRENVHVPVKKIKEIEIRLAKDCKYCFTTSHVMAETIARTYNVITPRVMYNVFPWSDRDLIDRQVRDRNDLTVPSICWFSQTIGRDRGLEAFMKSLVYFKFPFEVHLRGNCSESTLRCLESIIPSVWRNRVFFHHSVPYNELVSRIAEHDIGLSLDEGVGGLNRYLTISNKLFQYLHAGLAVVANDTAGNREIFSQFPDIGRIVQSGQPDALVKAIEYLICSKGNLEKAKATALRAARERLCWEKEKDIVLRAAESALNRA